jgi:NADP-dependent 3-hydroxy acid dehydrogenase YdfG
MTLHLCRHLCLRDGPEVLSGRIALVTGATGDIGQAICASLVSACMRVIAVGRSKERLASLAARLSQGIELIAADLTCEVERIEVGRAAMRFGRLDLLVLGSGIYERSQEPSMLERQFAANVHAPYALLRTLLPLLKTGSGQIVFINSSQGLSASPGIDQYAATQHAMRAIADSLRKEVNPAQVRVTSIFLGRTATSMQERIFALEERRYTPEQLIQPYDVALVVMNLLALSPSAQVTDISLLPQRKLN